MENSMSMSMSTSGVEAGWVPVARETLEYTLRPWMGRKYESWLRASMRPHPIDPRGQVLVPDRLYRVFASRPIYGRVTAAELAAAGYPVLPEEAELETARRELRQAIASHQRERIPALYAAVRDLEERVAAAKRSLRDSGWPSGDLPPSTRGGRPAERRGRMDRQRAAPVPVPSPA
jgi:hypothetical protein